MRILFIIDTLGSGGKERRLTELLKALKSWNGFEFELVVMSNDIHYKEIFELGIPIRFITRKIRKDIALFYRFYKLCRNNRPDIVHCWDSMSAVYLAPACRLLKIKLVNGLVIDSPVRQNIFNKHWLRARLTFPLSDAIAGNSEAGLKAYNAPRDKSFVIHNGFDFGRVKSITGSGIMRKQLNIGSENVVGMVATFSKYKDYPTYFRAAQMVLQKRKDVVFLAIGNGTDSDKCLALIDPENRKHFRLLGKVSDTESYINAMDVCVLATYTEGISNSILEYMALGKPVIATRGGGTGELVSDNESGFLTDPSEPGELSDRMEMLINDKQLRDSIGLNARKRVIDHFSIDQMIEKYAGLYKKMV